MDLTDHKDENLWLMKGDCLELMKNIPDGSVDMILCDLPYGTTQNKWDYVIPFEPLWQSYKRVCKPSAAIVLTAAQPFTSALVMSNPRRFRYLWYWRKNRATNVLNAKRQPLRDTEEVCVFGGSTYNPQGLIYAPEPSRNGTKDSANWGGGTSKSYLREWTNYPRQTLSFDVVQRVDHPTQKPVALMEYLIRTYTNEGETVLDNTMGSGTTGVACVNTNRKFIGIEMDDTYFDIAKTRVLDSSTPKLLETFYEG
jgi:site-specific DNA-methyltransferase (adenine-specific)